MQQRGKAVAVFGESIRAARVRAGMTLRAAAEAAELTEDGLSKIERDVNSPQLGTLSRLAAVYGVQVGDLLPHSATEGPDVEAMRKECEMARPLLDALAEMGEHERLLMIYTLATQVKTLHSMLGRFDDQKAKDGTPG